MTRRRTQGKTAGALLLSVVVCACNVVPTLSATGGGRVAHQVSRGDRWGGDDAPTYGGPGLDLRWYPWADGGGFGRGVALGVEESWMPAWAHTSRGRRENLLVGWGYTPRDRQRGAELGAEVTLVPAGWAHLHYAGDVESAFTVGARGALLLKLPSASCECGDALWAYRSLLVLELGWNMHRPYVAEDAPPWLGEGLATLGYRFDISLLP